jgi:hypothetical protein
MELLASSVSAISEKNLSRDPSAFSAEELDDRSYVFEDFETPLHSATLVKSRIRRFLGIEECYESESATSNPRWTK